MIEPRCDDGTEAIDEERGLIVAGGVIAFGFETGAELLNIGFYIVKHPREVLGGVELFLRTQVDVLQVNIYHFIVEIIVLCYFAVLLIFVTKRTYKESK